MRAVEWRDAPIDDEFLRFTETCVQCRGCEPACPSGVPYGHLIEATKAALAERHAVTPRWQRAAYALLSRHRTLLAGSSLLAVAQRARLVPPRVAGSLTRVPLRRGHRPASTGGAGHRARRVAVHRMRDGRLAAGDAPGHGGTRRRHRRHHPLVVGPGRLLRRPARARRVGGPGPPARRAGDGRHAGDGAGARQLGRMRRRVEGLRTAGRHRRRGRVRGTGRRRPRVAGRPRRRPAPAATPARPGDRAGSVPPAPRAAGAPARAHGARPLRRQSSSSTTTACAAGRVAPTPRCSRRSRPTFASASWRRSSAPARRVGPPSWPAPTRAAPCTSPPPASRCAIPST